MEVYKIEKNKQNNTNLLNKDNLRVAAYTRVSSIERNGGISIESQKKYYENKIKSNPNWIYKGVFSDEGISGSSTNNRKGFQRLLLNVVNEEIDFVLTKSISRFARNTVDALKYIRIFKNHGVGILFEEENINTMSMESELVITILSSVAQQELENLSASVKYGQRQNFKEGKISARFVPYGYSYNSETKEFEINQKEAKVVKIVFKEYLKTKSLTRVAKYLFNHNIKTKQNKDIWNHGSLKEMLNNKCYIGSLIIGKYYNNNPIDKRTLRNNGEEDMYYIENHHEPIIDKETFDKVQKLLQENLIKYSAPKVELIKKYPFSGKIKCGYCGYGLSKSNRRDQETIYKCSYNAFKYCENNHYYRVSIIDGILDKAYSELRKIKFKQKYINENLKSKELFIDKLIKVIYFGKSDNPFYTKIVLKDNDVITYHITHKYKDKIFENINKIKYEHDFAYYDYIFNQKVEFTMKYTYIDIFLDRMY